MTTFKRGQRIHVEFDGLYEGPSSSNENWAIVKSDDGYVHKFWPASLENIATPADPDNWPPQEGDVWDADDDEWFAGYSMAGVAGEMVLTRASTRSWLTVDQFAIMNPCLVRRRALTS